MRKLLIIFILAAGVSFGQFKADGDNTPDIKKSITNPFTGDNIFSFFNPDNFSMSHSFSMSYGSMGSQGLALGVYTNSMAYKFADNLSLSADISLVNTPYNTYGDAFTENLNGLYLSNATLQYKPWENTKIVVQYRQVPGGMYSPYYGGYNYGGFNNGFFSDR